MNIATNIFEPVNAGIRVFEHQEILSSSCIVEGGLTFRNCTINVTASINNCTFENCTISCDGLMNCTLTNCDICVGELGISNCKIENPQLVRFDNCSVTGCTFSNISCDDDAIIFPEDSKIINCRFENIKLTNHAYLISGIDDCRVSNCRFENCTTDRDDLKIIYCERTTGKLIKKTKACVIAEHNCIGLDAVRLC